MLIAILIALITLLFLGTASTIYWTLLTALVLMVIVVTNLATPHTLPSRIHEAARKALSTDIVAAATEAVVHQILTWKTSLVVHYRQLVCLALWQAPVQIEVIFGCVASTGSVDENVVFDTGKAICG